LTTTLKQKQEPIGRGINHQFDGVSALGLLKSQNIII
jgi:hypothetical protein